MVEYDRPPRKHLVAGSTPPGIILVEFGTRREGFTPCGIERALSRLGGGVPPLRTRVSHVDVMTRVITCHALASCSYFSDVFLTRLLRAISRASSRHAHPTFRDPRGSR